MEEVPEVSYNLQERLGALSEVEYAVHSATCSLGRPRPLAEDTSREAKMSYVRTTASRSRSIALLQILSSEVVDI